MRGARTAFGHRRRRGFIFCKDGGDGERKNEDENTDSVSASVVCLMRKNRKDRWGFLSRGDSGHALSIHVRYII